MPTKAAPPPQRIRRTGLWVQSADLLPALIELLRHIVPPGIRHLSVLHGRLNVGVSDPVLDALHAESLAQLMRGAAVLEHMEMAELRRNAGSGAVLLHQQMERGAVDRPLLLRQEDRPGEAAANF